MATNLTLTDRQKNILERAYAWLRANPERWQTGWCSTRVWNPETRVYDKCEPRVCLLGAAFAITHPKADMAVLRHAEMHDWAAKTFGWEKAGRIMDVNDNSTPENAFRRLRRWITDHSAR